MLSVISVKRLSNAHGFQIMGVYYFAVLFRDPLYIPRCGRTLFEGVDYLRAFLFRFYGEYHMPSPKVVYIQILLPVRHIERNAVEK